MKLDSLLDGSIPAASGSGSDPLMSAGESKDGDGVDSRIMQWRTRDLSVVDRRKRRDHSRMSKAGR